MSDGSHSHDHPPGHDHDHDHEPKASTPPPPSAPEPADDSDSQALSNALHSSFAIVKFVMVLLVIVFVCSGVFTVPSQERAILLRFGKPVGAGDQQFLGPGFHWSFPPPIDEVVRIPVSEIQTVSSSVGWYATTPEMEASNSEPPAMQSLNPASDGYALTSDGNIVHVRAKLRYRISNPLNYALNFVNASNVVENALNNALIYAAAYFTADQILRQDQLGYREKVLGRVRQLVDQQAFGINVEQADVESKAPRQVKDAFDKVTAADLESRKAINEAEAYAHTKLSTAQGEAAGVTNSAMTDRSRLLQGIAAEAQYYQDQLPYYRENPRLFMARIQADLMSRVMTNNMEKIYLPERIRELRLQLSREPQKAITPAAAP